LTGDGSALDLSALHGRQVLLAEDNPVNQEVALDLLRSSGMLVDVADDGIQTVARATDNAYDLILMDMQMPNMDRVATTQAIRTLPDRQSLPILAMTANAFDEDRLTCLAAGASDHIERPVGPDRLIKNIASVDTRTRCFANSTRHFNIGGLARRWTSAGGAIGSCSAGHQCRLALCARQIRVIFETAGPVHRY
jgi:CheY-like chemotaxis protein